MQLEVHFPEIDRPVRSKEQDQLETEARIERMHTTVLAGEYLACCRDIFFAPVTGMTKTNAKGEGSVIQTRDFNG